VRAAVCGHSGSNRQNSQRNRDLRLWGCRLAAGVDRDLVSGAQCAPLVEAGQVRLDLVDDAARRVIDLMVSQGLFERPCVRRARPHRPRLASRALVREAEPASFVALTHKDIFVPRDGSILDALDCHVWRTGRG
jgi:beta-glucosidase-like glycosyl hydrolase